MSVVKCEMDLEYPSEPIARDVHRSVELDNEGYIRTEVRGRVIHVEAEAASLNSLMHTLDDFLSCLTVAEGIVERKG